MNQQSFGQKTGPDTAGTGSTSGPAEGPAPQASAGKASKGSKAPQANEAVLGPFTVRDLAVFGGTLILFVASLLPIFGARYNLWNLNNLFFLGLGIVLPLIVSALFAARRLSPATRIRIGSLSIDQFASVVASFAAAFFFVSVAGAYVPSLLVGLIGSLVLFAATVLGRFLPYVSGDFQDRAEVPAHVVAREAAVPVQKPRTPKEPKAEPAPGSKESKFGSKILSGGGLFGGAGAGSSAVQPGSRDQSRPVGQSAAAHAPATAAVPAAAAPVSTAPEVTDRAPAGDPGPATQAADVVRPSSAPAAEETQRGDIPAAAGSSAASALPHDGGTQPAASSGRGTASSGQGGHTGWEPPAATAVHQQVRTEEPIGATVDPSSRPDESEEQPIHEAFWFAVAQHRTAYDPRTGAPAFVVEPGGWVLALEDRGHEFLVQHTDGRLGVLRDLSNIERG